MQKILSSAKKQILENVLKNLKIADFLIALNFDNIGFNNINYRTFFIKYFVLEKPFVQEPFTLFKLNALT